MSGDKATLLDFGFSLPKIEKALRVTKNAGLQPALDWLADHADDPDPTPEEEASEAAGEHEEGDEEGGPGGLAEAKVRCWSQARRAVGRMAVWGSAGLELQAAHGRVANPRSDHRVSSA